MTSRPGDETPSVPAMVGPYRLESRIGGGGMGEVYRAYDERLDRAVAIKHIRPDVAEDPRIRRRLRREAHVIASLNHPAIVRLYDILETDAGDWIVMELLAGRTLRELVSGGHLSLAERLFLVSEVAAGLAEAHEHGIVHRDLKTENVMVVPASGISGGRASAGRASAGRAKILDFGLAKMLRTQPGDTVLSIQGTIVGTGRAMSPEQARGDEIDPRSDLFSLGSLLYEVVTGRSPFLGASVISTLTRICSHRQPPARELNPQVPEEVSDYIDRLLEKNAADRPQSTSEVAATLLAMARRLDAEPSPAPPKARRQAAPEAPPVRGARVMTLLRLSLDAAELPGRLDAAELPGRLGDARAREVLSRHAGLVRELLAKWSGLEIDAREIDTAETDAPEGFLLAFERPVDAVDYAVFYHRRLAFLAAEVGVDLRGRVAVHLGEISRRDAATPGGRWAEPAFEVEAAARTAVKRTAGLARPGQTLVTRGAYDMARRALAAAAGSGEPSDDDRVWLAHGRFRLTGAPETVRIFEVRAADAPALPPPLATAGARRAAAREGSSAAGPPRRRQRRALVGGAAAALALAALATALWLAGRLPLPPSPDASELRPPGEAAPATRAAGRFYAAGLAKAREGDAARARDLLRRALAHDPDHALAHAALSEALAELGDTSLAAESARRAFELRRTLPRPQALGVEGVYSRVSGLVLLGQSRPAEARQAFARARDLFAAAGDHQRAARAAADLARLDAAR